jgi:phage terminase large subunit-like protein
VPPNKLKSPDKIDGACALFMAFGCASLPNDEANMESYFQKPVQA